MRVLIWLAVLLAGVPLSSGVIPAAPAISVARAATTAPPAPPSPWRWQNPRPQGNTLSAVACPGQNTCFAVGSGTIMVSHDAGKSWSVTFDKADGALTALSCPDHLTCYAIANTGANATAIVGTKDGGSTWTRLWQGQGGLEHLSCPSVTICYAAGQYVAKLLRTRDGGTTWSGLTPPLHPVDISCPAADVCYAPLATNLITSPPPSVAITTNGGASWTNRQVGIGKGQAQLANITCVSATTCSVIGYGDNAALYAPFALRTTDGGASWRHQSFPLSAPFRAAVIACPTAAVCYLGGDNGTVAGVLVTTSNGGQTWKRGAPLPFVPTGIACGGVRRCIATGDGGALLRTETGWAARTMVTRNAVHGPVTLPSFNLQAIACPSRSACYAAGDFGTLVKTTSGGRNWAAVGGSLARQSHGASISTLACASPSVCYAGIYATLQNKAMVLSTRDGGRSWSAKPGIGLDVVVCPGRNLCYAGGSRGLIEVSRDGGRSWSRQRTPLAGKPYEIQHLVCPSPGICYATALGPSEPPPHPRSNIGAILSTHDGGRTWRSTHTDPYPFTLACLSSSNCFALIAGDLVNGTVPLLVTHDGGRTWSRQLTLPPGYWQAATCVNRNTCYLAGWFGSIAVTRDAGRTWQQQPTPTFNNLEAIRCAGNDCYAAGEFGTILAGPAPLAITAAACSAGLTVSLHPGLPPGMRGFAIARDIPRVPVLVSVPLYPGVAALTRFVASPFSSYPASPYLQTAAAEYRTSASVATVRAWYPSAFNACGWRPNGSSSTNASILTSGLSFVAARNRNLTADVSFGVAPNGGAYIGYAIEDITYPPRPLQSYLHGPFVALRIALQRGALRQQGSPTRHVVHLTVTNRRLIAQFVRAINGLTGYFTVPGVCSGGLSLVGPAWLTFVRPHGPAAHAFESGPGVCGGLAVNGVRWLIDDGRVWGLITRVAGGGSAGK